MPKYSKNSENRWVHPNYRKAYVFKRESGMAFTCIDSHRQSTPYEFLPKNKKAIMELLNNRLSAHLRPVETTEDSTTRSLYELIKIFTQERLSKLEFKTRQNYQMIFKTFFEQNFQLDDIDGMRKHILEVKNNFKLSDNTIRKKLVRINAMFRFAIEMEWMTKSPIVKQMVPIYKKRKVVTCENIELQILIRYFNQTQDFTMAHIIEFAHLTGMRIQEILDIRWADIKEKELIIHGKGDRERNFPLRPFPRVIEILEAQKLMKLTSPFPYKSQQVPQHKLRKATATLELRAKENGLELDLSHIGFHVIRKTTINEWRGKGISQELRNKVMGHSREIERESYLLELELEQIERELLGKMRVK